MKEQLISFETAKLAKEKGFDVGCQHGWYKHFISGESFVVDDLGNRHEIERPTQALLQKWLREVYNLHIQLHYDPAINKWEYRIYVLNEYIYDTTNNKVFFNADLNFNTYEEALEQGLIEGLKLIK